MGPCQAALSSSAWGLILAAVKHEKLVSAEALPEALRGAAVDSTVMETYGTYLDRLHDLGLAYTHVIEGGTQTTREVPDELDLADPRRRAPGAYVANNQLDAESAQQPIDRGEADLVAFGGPFIANPDLVERIRIGARSRRLLGSTGTAAAAAATRIWPLVPPQAA